MGEECMRISYIWNCKDLELMEAASPRSCSRRFPLRIWPDGTLDFSCFTVKSGQLQKNLEGCEEAVLFAAIQYQKPLIGCLVLNPVGVCRRRPDFYFVFNVAESLLQDSLS